MQNQTPTVFSWCRAKLLAAVEVGFNQRIPAGISLALGVGLAIATLAILLQAWWAPRTEIVIDSKAIAHEQGAAYVAAIRNPYYFPLIVASDRGYANASTLRLLEDGRALGPAHSVHADIRATGDGRFSHWGDRIYFSSSDSSDPRTNGRRYTAIVMAEVSTVASLAVMLANLAFVLLLRGSILGAISKYRGPLSGILVLAAVVAAAAIFGATPLGQPKDLNLVIAVGLHVVIAAALTLLQWGLGAGLARAVLPKQNTPYSQIVLLGFPLSLAMLAALAAVALVAPYGLPLTGALTVLCLWPLYRWPIEAAALRDLFQRLPAMLLFGTGFGCWLALQWHGPTATLDGHPSGDLVFYAASVHAISAYPFPLPNLGNAGEYFGHFNKLIPALGAALRPLFEVDGFLFVLATSGVMSVVGTGIALHAYLTERPNLSLISPQGFALMLAVLVAGRYPYWIAESPPVAHIVPLTLAVWFWTVDRRQDRAVPLIAAAIALVGSVLSKVAGFATLGPLALLGMVRDLRRLPTPLLAATGLLVLICGGYAVLSLVWYLPHVLQAASVLPESYELTMMYGSIAATWPYIARDIGCLVLAVMALAVVPWPYAAAVSFGFVISVAFPFVIRINFAVAVVLLGLAVIDAPARSRRWFCGVAAGLLLLLPAMVLTDPGGKVAGVVWLVAMGGLLCVTVRREVAAIAPTLRDLRRLLVPAAAVILGLLLIAQVRAVIPSAKRDTQSLTPDVRDIWRAVRELTPADALIFTDQTGQEPTLLGGWNTYAFHGERQVYLSNWYQSRELRNNPGLRDARLQINARALSGLLAPAELSLHQKYGSYYAVVAADRSAPPLWRNVYRNSSFALWRLP